MAKKKASAKKSNAKKVVKKAASKKSPSKVSKKAPAKKAPAKKAAVKKAVAKKTPVKKAKAAPKVVKKTAPAVVVAAKPAKTLNLSNFVTPLDDRLIVQISGAEKMTAGGLYIPDTVADVSGNLEGHVVAVGRGHQGKKGHIRPMDVKLGDRVIFSEYAGSKINLQNQDLIILREADVLGVVSK